MLLIRRSRNKTNPTRDPCQLIVHGSATWEGTTLGQSCWFWTHELSSLLLLLIFSHEHRLPDFGSDRPTFPPSPSPPLFFFTITTMSGALSKRQQARNERTLQDLIKSIPGNSTCADCSARNPGKSDPPALRFGGDHVLILLNRMGKLECKKTDLSDNCIW